MHLPRILITAGEPAGVGPDVVLQALRSEFSARIAVATDIHLLRDRARELGIDCDIKPLDEVTNVSAHSPNRIEVVHVASAATTIPGVLNPLNAGYVLSTLETAAQLVGDNIYDAVVTAPVQKSIINDSGIAFSGHTEFFAGYFNCPNVIMLLANQALKVALATTHLPLREVPDAITTDSLVKQLRIINRSITELYGISKPKIAMLGLNPHAGEGGHLGREEIDTLIPACNAAHAEGIDVTLPLPADTAFVSDAVKAADVVFAMFHDQGLPVLKTMGFGHSVNITLGLPIIRTSVDHGTALSLAGTGQASEGSLIAAINEAITCAHNRS